ncbi:hypothetical protein OUZ56_015158 [Daphnia magna]|uniref:Uncharacterized protein n=1 Tax=Daphnia magna TaxID=35525 RepID=A0ABR0AM04_9CRUS|nr:hypothetical protein OUZ56_015158 [Daphnia magna]
MSQFSTEIKGRILLLLDMMEDVFLLSKFIIRDHELQSSSFLIYILTRSDCSVVRMQMRRVSIFSMELYAIQAASMICLLQNEGFSCRDSRVSLSNILYTISYGLEFSNRKPTMKGTRRRSKAKQVETRGFAIDFSVEVHGSEKEG